MTQSQQILDFLESIQSFSADSYSTYQTNFQQIYNDNKAIFDTKESKADFSKQFHSKVRLLMQSLMQRSISTSSEFYNKDIECIITFAFWAAHQGYFDINNAFFIMEDTYDCLSVGEIFNFFNIVEQEVSKIPKFTPVQYQALLRIGNSILKRFSKEHDNELRGRVQLMLSSATSLCEKTAVNLKSTINPGNPTSYESQLKERDAFSTEDCISFEKGNIPQISFGFYQKFWELQRFLQNPSLLFEETAQTILQKEDAEINSTLDIENNGPENGENQSTMDQTATSDKTSSAHTNKKTANVNKTKLEAFIGFIKRILDIFKADPISEGEDISSYTSRYPKYFTKASLLNQQIRDPYFRKTFLCQVMLAIWCIKHPLKVNQKKLFEVKDQDLTKVMDLERGVATLVKGIREKHEKVSLYEKIKLFLDREKNWNQWKEGGCATFEKETDEATKKLFKSVNDNMKQILKFFNLKKPEENDGMYRDFKTSFTNFRQVNKQSQEFSTKTKFENGNPIFSDLRNPKLSSNFEPLEPGIGYYYHSFLSEKNDDSLQDDEKLAGDPQSVWRALRVLTKNHINLFNTASQTTSGDVIEVRLDDVLNKMIPKETKTTPIATTGDANSNSNTANTDANKEENKSSFIKPQARPLDKTPEQSSKQSTTQSSPRAEAEGSSENDNNAMKPESQEQSTPSNNNAPLQTPPPEQTPITNTASTPTSSEIVQESPKPEASADREPGEMVPEEEVKEVPKDGIQQQKTNGTNNNATKQLFTTSSKTNEKDDPIQKLLNNNRKQISTSKQEPPRESQKIQDRIKPRSQTEQQQPKKVEEVNSKRPAEQNLSEQEKADTSNKKVKKE